MKTLLAITSALLCIFNSEAQSDALKQIGQNAKQKLEAQDFNTTRSNRERGNLIDDKKSRGNEAVPSLSAPSPAPSQSSQESEVPTPTEGKVFTFHTQINYKYENYSNTAHNQSIKYAFGDQCVQISMGNVNTGSLLDGKNQRMIVLNHSEKTAISMSLNMIESVASKGKTTENTPKVTKTGRTKTILGYTCHEYLIVGSTKSEVWISSEPGINISEEFMQISKNFLAQMPKETFENGGMMMECYQFNASGKAETHLIVTELKKEPSQFDLSPYQITEM